MTSFYHRAYLAIAAALVSFVLVACFGLTVLVGGETLLVSALAIAAPLLLLALLVARALATKLAATVTTMQRSIETARRDLLVKTETLDTGRHEMEALMGAISDAVVAIGKKSTIEFFNSRFHDVFGDGKPVQGKLLWEYFRAPEVLESFSRTLASGGTELVPAVPFDTATGRRFFAVSVSALRKQDSEIYGAVGVFHDVTELKRAEQMRIDFVANVSHELRTPLTSIQGYAETIAQDAENGQPAGKDFIHAILRNTERLRLLMNDLLDLSSIESSDTFECVQVGTEQVTEKVITQMRQALTSRDHKVTTTFEAANVWAEPRRLEQVLTNLLDNANKYTPSGGSIHVQWKSAPGQVVLEVKDTGPGIPAEHHSRLFERFYRVDKSRSREIGGTGLGLAIVKHILQRHGGSVSVKSSPGEGTTFICEFPES